MQHKTLANLFSSSRQYLARYVFGYPVFVVIFVTMATAVRFFWSPCVRYNVCNHDSSTRTQLWLSLWYFHDRLAVILGSLRGGSTLQCVLGWCLLSPSPRVCYRLVCVLTAKLESKTVIQSSALNSRNEKKSTSSLIPSAKGLYQPCLSTRWTMQV